MLTRVQEVVPQDKCWDVLSQGSDKTTELCLVRFRGTFLLLAHVYSSFIHFLFFFVFGLTCVCVTSRYEVSLLQEE